MKPLTLLTLLFPLFLSAQKPKLWENVNYEWNRKKTIGLSVLVLASLADGILEGYQFDGRKSFERKIGVKPISYAGSQSWLLAYKDHDVNKGFKSKYREWAGSPDLYHHLDDLRKYGYISAGICIGIGAKKGKFKDTWKSHLIDFAFYSIASSVSKSVGMYWVRN